MLEIGYPDDCTGGLHGLTAKADHIGIETEGHSQKQSRCFSEAAQECGGV